MAQSSPYIDVVKRQLDAYNARDLNAFVGCYHPEVHVVWLDGSRPERVGLESFRENYRELFGSSPNLKAEIVSRIVLGASVVDEERVHGLRGSTEPLHAVAIYGFKDGLIHRVSFAL